MRTQRQQQRLQRQAATRLAYARELRRWGPAALSTERADIDLPINFTPTSDALSSALQGLIKSLEVTDPNAKHPESVGDAAGVGIGGALQVLQTLSAANPVLNRILAKLQEKAFTVNLDVPLGASPLRVALTNMGSDIARAANKYAPPTNPPETGPVQLRILTAPNLRADTSEYQTALMASGGTGRYHWSLVRHAWCPLPGDEESLHVELSPDGTLNLTGLPGASVILLVRVEDMGQPPQNTSQSIRVSFAQTVSFEVPDTIMIPGDSPQSVQIPILRWCGVDRKGAKWKLRNLGAEQQAEQPLTMDYYYGAELPFLVATNPTVGQYAITVTNPDGTRAEHPVNFEPPPGEEQRVGSSRKGAPSSTPGAENLEQEFSRVIMEKVGDQAFMNRATPEVVNGLKEAIDERLAPFKKALPESMDQLLHRYLPQIVEKARTDPEGARKTIDRLLQDIRKLRATTTAKAQ